VKSRSTRLIAHRTGGGFARRSDPTRAGLAGATRRGGGGNGGFRAAPRECRFRLREYRSAVREFPSESAGTGTVPANFVTVTADFGSVPADSEWEFANSRQVPANSVRNLRLTGPVSTNSAPATASAGRKFADSRESPRIPYGIREGPYAIRGGRKRAKRGAGRCSWWRERKRGIGER
jgi:hypothetical protein